MTQSSNLGDEEVVRSPKAAADNPWRSKKEASDGAPETWPEEGAVVRGSG